MGKEKEIIKCELKGKEYRKENCDYPIYDCINCPGLLALKTRFTIKDFIRPKPKTKKSKRNAEHKERKSTLLPADSFNYWNGWAIYKKDKKDNLIDMVVIGEYKSIKEKDKSDKYKHKERLWTDHDYLFALINESPVNLNPNQSNGKTIGDAVLQRFLLIDMMEWSYKARFGDIDAREKIDNLCKALKGRLPKESKSEETSRTIGDHIDIFKRTIALCKSYLEKGKKKSLSKVFQEITKKRFLDKVCREIAQDYDVKSIEEDTVKKICKAYRKAHKNCFRILKSDADFFHFLDLCRESIDKPFAVKSYKNFTFIKGDFKDNKIIAEIAIQPFFSL